MAPTEMVASLRALRKLCSIFFILCIISYTVTPGNSYYIQPGRTIGYKSNVNQNYDQEYDFPEADPLFGPIPRAMDRIPLDDPKQRSRRRGRRSSGQAL